jgi:hypothetical protein
VVEASPAPLGFRDFDGQDPFGGWLRSDRVQYHCIVSTFGFCRYPNANRYPAGLAALGFFIGVFTRPKVWIVENATGSDCLETQGSSP